MPDEKFTIQPRESYVPYRMEMDTPFIPLILLSNGRPYGKPIEAYCNSLCYAQKHYYAFVSALKKIISSTSSNPEEVISSALYENVREARLLERNNNTPNVMFRLFYQSESFTEFSQQLTLRTPLVS